LHLCVCTSVRQCVCVCMCLCVYYKGVNRIHICGFAESRRWSGSQNCTYLFMCVTHTFVCMCVCMYVCMCVCIYVCVD